jgi:collagen type VII alpha
MRRVGAGSVACVGLLACGGSSSGVGAGDGGSDASTDVTSSAETGGDGPASGDDGPTGDVGTPGETGAPEAGGDAGCTGTGTTCRTCCRTDNPDGYKTLVTAELACACKPSVCGPLEAGAGDGGSDASDIGVGACTGTCGGTTLPDATCDKCLTDATGSMADPGECYTPVSTACENDAKCVAYVTCLTGCQ